MQPVAAHPDRHDALDYDLSAPIANPDATVNLLELGRIEHTDRVAPHSLGSKERAALDAVREDPLAARVLTTAAHCTTSGARSRSAVTAGRSSASATTGRTGA